MTHTWPDVLTALVGGHDLTAEQATWAMGQVLAVRAILPRLTALIGLACLL